MHLYCDQWQNTQCSFKYFEQCLFCMRYMLYLYVVFWYALPRGGHKYNQFSRFRSGLLTLVCYEGRYRRIMLTL